MTARPLSDQLASDTDTRVRSVLERPDVFGVLTLLVVQAAVVLAGLDLTVAAGISATTVIVSATIPVWWREVASFSLAVPILLLSGVAIVGGLYLAELSAADHVLSRSLQISSIVHIIDGLAIMVAVLWGRSHFPLHWIAALYGSGALADALLNTSRSWKFDLAVPATILVIGWMDKYRGSFASAVALVGLGALGILDEGRSYAAFCVAAAGLVVWQMRATGADRPTSRWYPAVLLATFAAAIYGIASSLLTSGRFGPELQRRSIDQIDATGSLIAGGRPEWAATRALVAHRPRGYGVGVVPDLVDHGIAENGLASINVDTGGYLTNYMMGGQFRLHSITSDLWVSYGFLGVLLAAVIAYAIIRSVSARLAERQAPALVVFMGVLALWHLAFGPIYSNWPDVCFALGVVLPLRAHVSSRSADLISSRSTDLASSRSAGEPGGRWSRMVTDSPMGRAVHSVGKSALVRFVLLPVSAVLGIFITRIIVDNYGVEAFAQYGLLVTIGTLLPFADLGMAAAVMNAVAESPDPQHDPHVRRTITTAIRMLIVSAIVLLALVVVISVSGGWSTVLGDGLLPEGGAIAAAICLGLIAVTLPIGIGQRILRALGRNHIAILLFGLQSPIVLVTLLLFVRTDLELGAYVAVIPYAAVLVISAVAAALAARRIRPVLGLAARDAPHPRRVAGATVFDVAWPALIQMIALPVAMQSDRLILSHVSDAAELGRYNLSAQMFLPIWQVTSAAGVALWPVFARARASAEQPPSPLVLSTGFAGMASIAAVAIAAASPFLAEIASGGRIDLPIELVVVFAGFMVLQAANYPLGTYMTDAPGLRYQAKMVLLMLPVNVGMSLLLASRYGAVGPVIGSFVGVGVFQLAANLRYVRHRTRIGSG